MNAAPNIFGPAGGTGSGAVAHCEIGLAERPHPSDGFVEAIRSGADTGHPTIEEDWRVAAVCGAVRRSSASGAWEDFG